MKPSPYINLFYKHHPIHVTLDTGAETNMIKESTAIAIGAKSQHSSQLAFQADGTSELIVKGETEIELSRDGKTYKLKALIIDNIDLTSLAEYRLWTTMILLSALLNMRS